MHDFFTANGLFCNFIPMRHKSDKLLSTIASDVVWDLRTGKAGFGFITYTNYMKILLAGAAGNFCASSLEAELRTILLAVESCH